jgi:hypothetical protein
MKKRWPIRSGRRHKAAVWMTRNDLMQRTFRCSECGGRDVAKSI